MIFQALGSTNNYREALRHLFVRGRKKDSEQLIQQLENMFDGKAILYSKGRHALAAALKETASKSVAINGFTCSVVVDAVLAARSEPVFIDINDSYNFSTNMLETTLKSNSSIKAIIVQNTFGHMADIASIESIARKYKCILIEDLAHSLGLQYPDGRTAGTVGDFVMLSFGRDKAVDVTNGGALIIRKPNTKVPRPTTSTPFIENLRDRLYPILSWKIRATFRSGFGKLLLVAAYKTKLAVRSADGKINTNIRLSHWKARLIFEKISTLETTLAHRQKIHNVYADSVPTIQASIRTPVILAKRDEAIKALETKGVFLEDTWYSTPIGPSRKYAAYHYPADTNPQAVQIASHIINLPTHQYVSEDDARTIAKIVKEFV